MKSQIQYKEEINDASAQAPNVCACLNNKDVIASKISDHHPIVHNGILFWNVMMQGRKRGNGFNNGFGIIENDADYKARLSKIAEVIAEVVEYNPSIEAICLCEGPIKDDDTKVLNDSLKAFPSMQRFISQDRFYKPNEVGPEWGLLMLADNRYKASKVNLEGISLLPNLVNRFQLWQLQDGDTTKYVALAHFPFSGDVYTTDRKLLSARSQVYCQFIQYVLDQYQDKSLNFCADFNFNPHLIGQPAERVLDHIINNNSILLNIEEKSGVFNVDTVTVDGVLLSQKEKQNYLNTRREQNLMTRLQWNDRFFKAALKVVIDQKEANAYLDYTPIASLQAG
ncbi:Uncharacterised protein [Legionella busanensis]|uniref:Endonuclease/Exonuclease/phosphatase family n=1 Tax=Legionella busanensis TaxID=190655 RepID=A0A378JIU6_9GAMM|nr:hypothetical protein [Legionella busanensis]STX50681.1 Uncharacterised protein [Legionella busanensis]